MQETGTMTSGHVTAWENPITVRCILKYMFFLLIVGMEKSDTVEL